jgi:ribosomal protein S18 acetylase RimI-like enzyme
MRKINDCIIILENIKLVSVTTEDLPFGYDLWKLTQKEFLEKIAGEWNDEFNIEYYKDDCNSNIENNYLIKYDGNNIGWFEYELIKKFIYINQLHILPEYQGKGVGSNILNEIINYGRKKNNDIYLDVLKYNYKALEFYKKWGFKLYDESSLFNYLVYEV